MGRSRPPCVSLLAVALGSACAQGGGSTSSGQISAGSIGGSSGGPEDGSGGDSAGSGSGSTASLDGAGASAGSDTTAAMGSSTAAEPTCTDAAMNGDETDIDCGGTCPPCSTGQTCTDRADCETGVCETGLCCTATMYDKTTGLISGTASVCCDGDDARLGIAMCGDGQNYTVQEEGANCASTSEGAMNDGSACVSITCQLLACDPA